MVRAVSRRRLAKPRESDVQETLIQYLNRVPITGCTLDQQALFDRQLVLGDFAYAVPNGVFVPGDPKRSGIIMNAMKRQGLKNGVSDVVLALPKHGWAGAYIELKRNTNDKPTPEQVHWILLMRTVGYYADVAHGVDEAIETVKAYMSGTGKFRYTADPPGTPQALLPAPGGT